MNNMNKIYESPVLVKEKNETPKILLYSNKEDQIKILDSGGKIVKEANVFAGKNIISLNTSDTESLIIQYVSSGKEVKLPR